MNPESKKNALLKAGRSLNLCGEDDLAKPRESKTTSRNRPRLAQPIHVSIILEQVLIDLLKGGLKWK